MIETRMAPKNESFPQRLRWTRTLRNFLADNGLLDEGHELIDGEMFLKLPKRPPHRIALWLLQQWLITLFGAAFVQQKGGIELPGAEGETSEPEPDLAVTLAPTTDYVQSNPGPQDIALIAEVSNTTLAFDLEVKAPLYARVGIPEYLVLDVAGRQIHRHRQPTQAGYADIVIVSENETLTLLSRTESVRVGNLLPPAPAAPA